MFLEKDLLKIYLKNDSNERLGGTVSSCIFSMLQGVQILRVHDVNEVNQGIKVFKKIKLQLMIKKYFGTDGIRGKVNGKKINGDMFFKFGLAAGTYFKNQKKTKQIAIIAKDTRLSGYTLEPALVSGLTSAGMHVFTFGPLPTNGLAMLTKKMRANMGIMITASHNPYYDNGLKLFGPDGLKLSDKIEKKIEKLIDSKISKKLSNPEILGRVKRLENGSNKYIEILKTNFPKKFNLRGLRITIDCANGAAYKVGPQLFRSLGAVVHEIGTSPNGFNINKKCGSTFPKNINISYKKINLILEFL